jgi:ABC-2 type transport system ATP-binding protein
VLIKLENIGKKFSNGEGGTQVLFNDVNVVVKRGDVISLIGANGAGKSTLLDIVVGYQKPSSGAVSYSFKYDYSPTEKMGVSYQKNNLLSSLTVWDYIIFSHRLYKSRTSLRDLVVFVYAFGIEKFCKMKVQKLSGGQQQRLNAMLSLFHDPEIILLDELCNNLDMTIKTKIVKFIKQYITVKNITGIIISHDLFEIGNLSNRVLVIKNQRIKIDETTKNAIKKYKGLDKLVAASM